MERGTSSKKRKFSLGKAAKNDHRPPLFPGEKSQYLGVCPKRRPIPSSSLDGEARIGSVKSQKILFGLFGSTPSTPTNNQPAASATNCVEAGVQLRAVAWVVMRRRGVAGGMLDEGGGRKQVHINMCTGTGTYRL